MLLQPQQQQSPLFPAHYWTHSSMSVWWDLVDSSLTSGWLSDSSIWDPLRSDWGAVLEDGCFSSSRGSSAYPPTAIVVIDCIRLGCWNLKPTYIYNYIQQFLFMVYHLGYTHTRNSTCFSCWDLFEASNVIAWIDLRGKTQWGCSERKSWAESDARLLEHD